MVHTEFGSNRAFSLALEAAWELTSGPQTFVGYGIRRETSI